VQAGLVEIACLVKMEDDEGEFPLRFFVGHGPK